MTQILQFCEEAIWIENGRIMLRDRALTVISSCGRATFCETSGVPPVPLTNGQNHSKPAANQVFFDTDAFYL